EAGLQAPVRASPYALTLDDEELSGGHALDILVDRVGAGHVSTAEVVAQRAGVDPTLRQPGGDERLDLGCEGEASTPTRVEERLDPDSVAGEHETPGRSVPDREREHAVEPRDGVGPLVLVEMDDR